ncbi:MAG: hypothetical protein FD123_4313, partial [Bacteroidetes bacterium]
MSRRLSILVFFILTGAGLFGQAPELINYQAIARDASGNEIQNTPLLVSIRIATDASATTIVYEETHTPTTNAFGLL